MSVLPSRAPRISCDLRDILGLKKYKKVKDKIVFDKRGHEENGRKRGSVFCALSVFPFFLCENLGRA